MDKFPSTPEEYEDYKATLDAIANEQIKHEPQPEDFLPIADDVEFGRVYDDDEIPM